MAKTHKFNRKINALGWGLLLILWGITILFDGVPFGVGLLGTGLIFLGANGIRTLNDIPTKDNNTLLGVLALAWGGLELSRPILEGLNLFADWDWAIFASLMVVLGLLLLSRELLRMHRSGVKNSHESV
jgi:hypothetical protein